MRTRAALLVVGLLASTAAAADGTFGPAALRADRTPAAMLYFEVPVGMRGDPQARPSFGLRLQQAPIAPLNLGPWDRRQSKTIFDVPFRARYDDPLRDSGASMLI